MRAVRRDALGGPAVIEEMATALAAGRRSAGEVLLEVAHGL
ncbi:hypothetical protein HNR21_004261 [Actinomadura cellulosilytica]|uniref:Uncharacterized protein n=1 Tax=Thermomonospora cellulosilytica TaxID=1411118 RepID=A0A7W3N0P2_9ACTN|nr:hypothetical protein [Thermomonospora cellulosilytica]